MRCLIEGCAKPPPYVRGWCGAHYQQWKRTGDPLPQRQATIGCSIRGCGRKHYGLGWCEMHWARFSRTGDPEGLLRLHPIDAFWSHVDKQPDHWLWTAATFGEGGYGAITTLSPVESGTRLAHRVAWELTHGPIPDDLPLDHVCRIKICVRPELPHLEPVTLAVNNQRKWAHWRAESNKSVVLTGVGS